jgi:RND family efflux transporter MFP subunit
MKQSFKNCRLVSLVVGSAFLYLVWGAGCSKHSTSTINPRPAKVTVATAREQEITDFDEYVGRTQAFETVEVRSRVSGFVQSVDFQDGSMVEKDQLLFKIEPDLYQAIHQQSLARVELWKSKENLAESKFARSKALLPSGAISKEEYDETVAAVKEAEMSVLAAQADAERTGLDLKYTDVRAEIAGRIDRAWVTRGNMVTGGIGNGTLLTRIVRNNPIYAYLDIDDRSALKYLRKTTSAAGGDANSGEPATSAGASVRSRPSLPQLNIPCYMQLADEKDYPHVGKLDFAENRVDSATGSIQVRGVFENNDGLLTGGLFVRIRVPVSEPYRAVLIPEQAIGTDQNIKFAYVVGEDKIPQRRNLVLGAQRGSMRIIKSGIQANEKVIYRGLQLVRPGQSVVPENAEVSVDDTADAFPLPRAESQASQRVAFDSTDNHSHSK